jgi:diaminopimelate decarboxylase
VEAHTHTHIITGMAENKFGIALADMASVIAKTQEMKHVRFIGLHFHIGSQITDMQDYFALCMRINELQHELNKQGIYPQVINVGGGLGIDYQHPERRPIADFKGYFHVFAQHLHLRSDQSLHFELGRSVVGQCGSLITRVLYVKQGAVKQFAIVDAGMTELIRPALYQAQHKIENLSSTSTDKEKYDVVGPICESSDVFAKDWWLPHTQRGDLLAIRSAGAYGESMASQYNCRRLPETVVETQEQLNLKYE